MTKHLLPNTLLLALISVAACNKDLNAPKSRVTANATKIYTKAELDKLVVPGMSISDVTNTFGIPASEIQVEQNIVILMYSFPVETVIQEGGPRLTGFVVDIRDGKVASWSPIMGGSRQISRAGGFQGPLGQQSFQIFLAAGNLTNVANTVDSQGSADASGLKASPEVAFKAKVFAGSSGNERPGEQSVILVVSDQDASKLKDLTDNNFGKRLLIVCRNKAVAAPVISVPITSNKLMFTVKDPSILEALRGE